MSEEELRGYIEKILEEEGVSDMSGMAKIMGRATRELAGKADGKTISSIVRSLLSR